MSQDIFLFADAYILKVKKIAWPFDPITFSKNSNYGREKCKGKTLVDVVNKPLNTKSLLTMPGNALPLRLMHTFMPII